MRKKILASIAMAAFSGMSLAETEINLLMIEGMDKTAMERLAKTYQEQNPDVTINIQGLPWSQFFQVSELRMKNADDTLDIIYTDAPMISNYAANGYLEPVNPSVIDEASSILVDKAFEAGQFEGTMYALPMNSSAQVLYYNIDMLEAAGAEQPVGLEAGVTADQGYIEQMTGSDRPTFEAVLDKAEKVKAQNADHWGFAFEQHGELYQLQPLGRSLGSKMISEDGRTAKGYLDSAEWKQAAEYWNRIFNVSQVSPRSLGFGEAAQLFNSGKLAMFIGGTWNIYSVADSGVNYGIAAHPNFADGEAVTPTGSWYLGVHSASEHQTEAARFVEFATLSKQGTTQWFSEMQQIPTTKDLIDSIATDEAYSSFPDNMMRLAALESVTSAEVRPKTVAYSQLQSAFRTAFVDISNGVEIDQALNNAVRMYESSARRLIRH